MLRRGFAALALCALLAAGCGDDGSSDRDDARHVVERFAQATARKDYQAICDDLLARKLVQSVERVGLPCESALQRGLGDVRAPKLRIGDVAVSGARALVSVRSSAAGQQPSDDAIQLVREDGGWRIASLARPRGKTTTTPKP